MDKICSFFGHHEVKNKEAVFELLTATVENLITKEGFTNFFFGRFGEFNELCYQCVSKLKEIYPSIKRIYCAIDEKEVRQKNYKAYLQGYDEVIYLPLLYDYWYTRIYYRNCEMIERSHFVIFYAEERLRSGAYKALQYAKRKKKKIVNFFEDVQNAPES